MKKEDAIQLCLNCSARDIEKTLEVVVTPKTIHDKLKAGKCPFTLRSCPDEKREKTTRCAQWIKSELQLERVADPKSVLQSKIAIRALRNLLLKEYSSEKHPAKKVSQRE